MTLAPAGALVLVKARDPLSSESSSKCAAFDILIVYLLFLFFLEFIYSNFLCLILIAFFKIYK